MAEFDEFTLPLGRREYRFRFGLREVIELQERLIEGSVVPTIHEIDAGIRAGRLRYQRALIWAGLREHHKDVSEDAATELMSTASRRELDDVLIAFGYSVTPDPKDVEALGIQPSTNPPTAQHAMTGADSISEPVGSV